jgi:mlo protein
VERMSGGEGEETTLEYTPTWVVAAVCTVIVGISLAMERVLHYAGKKLKKKGQKPLFEALQKVKEGISLHLYIFFFILLLILSFSLSINLFPLSVLSKMKSNIGGGTWQN